MHTHTNYKSAFSIYMVYTLYIQSLYLNMHLIWHVHRFVFRVSWHSSPSRAAVSWHRGQRYSQIQGSFASVQFGEVPLQWICLSYTMYMFSISNVYTCISYVYVNDRTGILRVYTPYSISCIENRSFLCFAWLGAMMLMIYYVYVAYMLRIYYTYTD
jgi:hypothetical protein